MKLIAYKYCVIHAYRLFVPPSIEICEFANDSKSLLNVDAPIEKFGLTDVCLNRPKICVFKLYAATLKEDPTSIRCGVELRQISFWSLLRRKSMGLGREFTRKATIAPR